MKVIHIRKHLAISMDLTDCIQIYMYKLIQTNNQRHGFHFNSSTISQQCHLKSTHRKQAQMRN